MPKNVIHFRVFSFSGFQSRLILPVLQLQTELMT